MLFSWDSSFYYALRDLWDVECDPWVVKQRSFGFVPGSNQPTRQPASRPSNRSAKLLLRVIAAPRSLISVSPSAPKYTRPSCYFSLLHFSSCYHFPPLCFCSFYHVPKCSFTVTLQEQSVFMCGCGCGCVCKRTDKWIYSVIPQRLNWIPALVGQSALKAASNIFILVCVRKIFLNVFKRSDLKLALSLWQ